MIITNYTAFLETYTKLKKSFKIRESSNYVEIVHQSGKKLYHNKNNKFAKGLYLFRMVKKDIQNYISENEVNVYQQLPTNFYNSDYNRENETIGIDINNAYWSVALLKGYITEKTYLKGLEKEDLKSIRLSTLSTLGKKRIYKVYVNGEYSHNEEKNESLILQNVYNDIRYSTYGVMYELSEILQNDFYCWKTDCVFFKNTKKNIKIVKEHIISYGLDCKIEKMG